MPPPGWVETTYADVRPGELFMFVAGDPRMPSPAGQAEPQATIVYVRQHGYIPEPSAGIPVFVQRGPGWPDRTDHNG